MRLFGCKDCDYSLNITDKSCYLCKTTKIPHLDVTVEQLNARKKKELEEKYIRKIINYEGYYSKVGVSRIQRERLFQKYPECLCCGSFNNLTVDHVIPICKGGSSEDENLQTLCRKCNNLKGNRIRDYRLAYDLKMEETKNDNRN